MNRNSDLVQSFLPKFLNKKLHETEITRERNLSNLSKRPLIKCQTVIAKNQNAHQRRRAETDATIKVKMILRP